MLILNFQATQLKFLKAGVSEEGKYNIIDISSILLLARLYHRPQWHQPRRFSMPPSPATIVFQAQPVIFETEAHRAAFLFTEIHIIDNFI